MGTVAETTNPRTRLSREAKIGLVAVGAVIATPILLGNSVVNEWEGWGVFLPSAIGAAIEGLVVGGLVFGLLVRIAVRSRGVRPAVTALVVGILAILSLAIRYSAPQVILGAAAVAFRTRGSRAWRRRPWSQARQSRELVGLARGRDLDRVHGLRHRDGRLAGRRRLNVRFSAASYRPRSST